MYNPFPEPLPTQGMIKQGFAPGTRIPVSRPDIAPGAYSTVQSITVGGDNGEPAVLLATTANDGSRMLTPREAIEQSKRDGSNIMGVFKTPQDADNYGQAYHNWDAFLYGNGLDLPSTIKRTTGYQTQKDAQQGFLEQILKNKLNFWG